MQNDFGYFEEDALGKPYDTRLFGRLLPFARPHAALFFWAAALVILITGLDLALPYVTKVTIDRYIVPAPAAASDADTTAVRQRHLSVAASDPGAAVVADRYPQWVRRDQDRVRIAYSDLERLSPQALRTLRRADLAGVGAMAALFMGLVLINFAANFVQVMVMEYAGQKIMHDLRIRIYTHIQSMPLGFFTRHPVGRLVTRATNDVQNMNELFTSVVMVVFKDLFLLLGIAAVLFSLSWRLTLISFVVLPFVAWASIGFARRSREAFRTLRVKVAEINTHFSETIGGIRILQLFGRERRNAEQFAELNHDNYLAGMRQIRVFALFMPMIEVLAAVTLAVVIYHGGRGVVAEEISLGALVAFISYMRMFFRPIRDIAEKYNIMQNAMASAERIFLILDTVENRPLTPPPAGTDGNGLGNIRFESVAFAYSGHAPVLKGLDFSVAEGETVALVGPTGAGKSTLIHLVARFYDPTRGRILFDGKEAAAVNRQWLRAQTALVMQEPFIFSDTVRSNILMGRAPVGPDEMDRILSAARCRDLVAALPQGLETVLAEGGKTLSSGERQLLTIARAFARRPRLILLDEATSHIDSSTEKKIQAALVDLLAGRTAFIVAHRLSTIRHADRILVLDRGRIIESGTHDQLMDRRGFYYNYHRVSA
jgi:ATP-binding cassette, subfamily B, multidrug efflux pump